MIKRPMDDDQARKLDEDIGMVTSPEIIAKEALRRHQEQMGMQFENPDAPVAPPLGSRDEEIPGAWMGKGG